MKREAGVKRPMQIREISCEEFDQYEPARHPVAQQMLTELSWYERADKKAIGTVVRDDTDRDYGFVALRHYADVDMRGRKITRMRAFEMGTSYATPEEARMHLEKILRGPLPIA